MIGCLKLVLRTLNCFDQGADRSPIELRCPCLVRLIAHDVAEFQLARGSTPFIDQIITLGQSLLLMPCKRVFLRCQRTECPVNGLHEAVGGLATCVGAALVDPLPRAVELCDDFTVNGTEPGPELQIRLGRPESRLGLCLEFSPSGSRQYHPGVDRPARGAPGEVDAAQQTHAVIGTDSRHVLPGLSCQCNGTDDVTLGVEPHKLRVLARQRTARLPYAGGWAA